MKANMIAVMSLASCLPMTMWAETVEMTTGPDLSVTYDSATWKPLAALRPPTLGTSQSVTWVLQNAEWPQVTVTNHRERKTEKDFKREIADSQGLRGDPATLVRERREALVGRSWLVLEFRNPNTRPIRSEVHYFGSSDKGYVHLFVIDEEDSQSKHDEPIQKLLGSIQFK